MSVQAEETLTILVNTPFPEVKLTRCLEKEGKSLGPLDCKSVDEIIAVFVVIPFMDSHFRMVLSGERKMLLY